MHKDWDKSGTCTEMDLKELICDFNYAFYVAYQTDKFLAGLRKIESLKRIEWNKLLEIRLFSETEELLARRTMIGKNNSFQWRIASEVGLSSDEYITRYQTLDIDSEYTQKGAFGNLKLMTTGGGLYELPIEEEMKSIKVISYISYAEEDGMSFIYDNRLAGFTIGGGK